MRRLTAKRSSCAKRFPPRYLRLIAAKFTQAPELARLPVADIVDWPAMWMRWPFWGFGVRRRRGVGREAIPRVPPGRVQRVSRLRSFCPARPGDPFPIASCTLDIPSVGSPYRRAFDASFRRRCDRRRSDRLRYSAVTMRFMVDVFPVTSGHAACVGKWELRLLKPRATPTTTLPTW